MTTINDFNAQASTNGAPKFSARQITYAGCGIALTLGLVFGLALRPDYANSQENNGPRLVVSSTSAP